jgi:hypothetical protein
MVPDYWTVLGRLSCPILTLPGELNLRDEAVGILVLAHHAIFLQRHEEEKMRRLGDEAGVPRGLIEGETESCGDGEVYPSTIYAPKPNMLAERQLLYGDLRVRPA